MNEIQEHMKAYFMQHKSEAHEMVKKLVNNRVEEFIFIDEFLIPLYDPKEKLAILFLSEDHDHADGYYIEALIQKRLKEINITCIFITERDVLNNRKLIRDKLIKSIQ